MFASPLSMSRSRPRKRPARVLAGALWLGALLPGVRASSQEEPFRSPEDTAFVHGVDAEWQSRLEEASARIAAGSHDRAIETLRRAIELGRDKLVRVRSGETVGADVPAGDGPVDDGDLQSVPGVPERDLEALRAALAGRRPRSSARRRGAFRPRYYVTVAERARQIIDSLPAAARRSYRERHEALATRELEAALSGSDPSALRRVALEFPATLPGVVAQTTLGDRYFDRGWVRRALGVWSRASRSVGEELSLLADANPGEDRDAGARVATLRSIDAVLRRRLRLALRGVGQTTAEALEARRIRQKLGAEPSGAPADAASGAGSPARDTAPVMTAHVPLSGTGASGGVVSTLPAVDPGAVYSKVWDSAWWAKQGILRQSSARSMRRVDLYRLHARREIEAESGFPFVPAPFGDSVLVSGVFHLWTMDLESGLVLPTGSLKRQITKPFVPREVHAFFKEKSVSPIYLPVVRDGQIFSTTISEMVMKEAYMGYTIYEQLPTRTLVCHDARTDDVLWHTKDFTLGVSDDPKPVSFVTPPLLVGDRVVAGGWIHIGHVTSVVAAFDRTSGQPLWNTTLCSNQMELTMFGEWAREPLGWILLEDEGIIYCTPGTGVVAALDAETGHVRWMCTYEAIEIIPSMGPYPVKRDLRWGPNPPVLLGGVLYAAPRDSRYLYAFDTDVRVTAGDPEPLRAGAPPRPILWGLQPAAGVSDFLGYHRGKLYLSGRGGVQALAVEAAAPEQPPAPVDSAQRWPRGVTIRGRPALSSAGIVFSHDGGLALVSYDDLSQITPLTTEPFPPSSHGSYPGNVVLWKDRILVMSRDLLSAFASETTEGSDGQGAGARPPERESL